MSRGWAGALCNSSWTPSKAKFVKISLKDPGHLYMALQSPRVALPPALPLPVSHLQGPLNPKSQPRVSTPKTGSQLGELEPCYGRPRPISWSSPAF
jgi:hypothetical protein